DAQSAVDHARPRGPRGIRAAEIVPDVARAKGRGRGLPRAAGAGKLCRCAIGCIERGQARSDADGDALIVHWNFGRAACADVLPPPLWGEGWGGGGCLILHSTTTPHPCPSPTRGEGTLWRCHRVASTQKSGGQAAPYGLDRES